MGFLQELCSLAKHLQVQQRGSLFASLIQHGLFYVLTDVLKAESETSQLKGADVLMSTLHNGQVRTMKANYRIEAGDVSVIRPLLYVREHQTKEFALAAQLPAVPEGLSVGTVDARAFSIRVAFA